VVFGVDAVINKVKETKLANIIYVFIGGKK